MNVCKQIYEFNAVRFDFFTQSLTPNSCILSNKLGGSYIAICIFSERQKCESFPQSGFRPILPIYSHQSVRYYVIIVDLSFLGNYLALFGIGLCLNSHCSHIELPNPETNV